MNKKVKKTDTKNTKLTEGFFSNLKNSYTKEKLSAIVVAVVSIAVVLLIAFVWIPSVYKKTDTGKKEIANIEIEKNWDEETFAIQDSISVEMKTNFGELLINLDKVAAPNTVENFLRLSHRDKYDGTEFHRIVKHDSFSVIQGGDFINGDGTGGYTGLKDQGILMDEIWNNIPEFDEEGVAKDYELASEIMYTNYNPETNEVTYPAGTIVMANSGPNSAKSQFFICLKDTVLGANYTAFGTVSIDTMAVLSEIFDRVGVDGDSLDGSPDQKIIIEEVVVK